MSEESPKLIAIDEEADHQIMHGCRLGKANRAAYKPLDPSSQIDVLALDGLRVLFTDDMLLWDDMPLVRPPTISVKRVIPNGSSNSLSCKKTVSCRRPKMYANTAPLT